MDVWFLREHNFLKANRFTVMILFQANRPGCHQKDKHVASNEVTRTTEDLNSCSEDEWNDMALYFGNLWCHWQHV